MGYTPAFDSIYSGTLYGKWPTAAVWASLLPLADARGEISLTPEAIAGMTGWPLELLRQGIEALCQPDPRSRSKAEDGRRLALIDPSRDWGWRVVNIGIYRAKASGLNQVVDGRNAEKVRRYKEKHRQTPADTNGHHRTPPDTRDTHSNSYTNTDKNKKGAARARRVPADFQPDLEYAKREIPDIDASREAQRFKDWEFKTPRSDWPATWRTWIGNCRDSGKYAKAEQTRWT